MAVLQTNASTVTTTPSPAEATAVPSISSADTVVYGSVPIDSDRLNTIAALAFDHEGQLLVSTRAGEIYRLSDEDDDGLADDRQLIFADADESLQQVAGMFMRGDSLILLNGDRLSQLRDSDGDGIYDAVRHLTEELPAGADAPAGEQRHRRSAGRPPVQRRPQYGRDTADTTAQLRPSPFSRMLAAQASCQSAGVCAILCAGVKRSDLA